MHILTVYRTSLLAGSMLLAAQPAAAEQNSDASDPDAFLTDTIIVTASRDQAVTPDSIALPQQIALPADAVAVAARVPGGDFFGNGALSGQLSYRGLAGERVLGRVNGQRFASGGPNAMDPPLHYAPSILVDRIEVARGVSPVSGGPALAGAANAELVQVGFTDKPSWSPQARMASQYRSVDNGYALGGLAGAANENVRIGVIASREKGEDYRFPGGTAVGTSFERTLYGAHAGFRAGPGELFVEYRRSETDPSGNPPFALDIVYFNTDFFQGGFRGDIADGIALNLRAGHVAVRHLMDNQSVRQPAASPMMARATFANADTSTAEGSVRFGQPRAYFEIGADAELTDKFVTITNPSNAAFFIQSQPNVASERVGGFVQWRGRAAEFQFELGARIDRTTQWAGVPQLGSAVPMGPRGLAVAFAAADRAATDTSLDVVLRSWMPMGRITPRITLARKQRVPSLLERFGWLPTEASFGLADGNIYVGNVALRPETAWIAEFGFDYGSDWLTVRPTIYYRRIDNFVQGVPLDATIGVIDSPVEAVAAMSGDATPLRFANTDAELFGADVDFSIRPAAQIEFAGTISVVRGQRRDIVDDLYRVSPANLRLSAIWTSERLTLGGETFVAARQNHVSRSNGEAPSQGYATIGLFARYALAEGLSVEAGMENVLDSQYQPHLSGRNRFGASDVPLDARLPGAGRGGWIRVTGRF